MADFGSLQKFWNRWNINSSRYYLKRYNEEFAAGMVPGMKVLDAGAGNQPYRSLFSRFDYETADFELVDKKYGTTTYVCDLAEIPVQTNRFDRVVLNQVLEHLPEPKLVLKELNRVLKPGGLIICTCPLYYDEHEQPYDFYRYTQFAHRYLFAEAGFEIDRLEWLEGYFGTLGYQFQRMATQIPLDLGRYSKSWHGLAGYPVVLATKLLSIALSGLFYRLDMVLKITDRGHPKNYVVIARKP